MKKKTIALVLACIVCVGIGIGGTLAWLTATTDSVVNTFTVGDVYIDLGESENLDLKMVPGSEITKDPKVTVKAGSEACWLFVKVEESDNLDNFISYTVDSGWTALTGVPGVYYREVAATTTDVEFAVLKDNKVAVKDSVTKTMADTMDGKDANGNNLADDALAEEVALRPTLTFTAYACQKDNVTSATVAWEKINPTT